MKKSGKKTEDLAEIEKKINKIVPPVSLDRTLSGKTINVEQLKKIAQQLRQFEEKRKSQSIPC